MRYTHRPKFLIDADKITLDLTRRRQKTASIAIVTVVLVVLVCTFAYIVMVSS